MPIVCPGQGPELEGDLVWEHGPTAVGPVCSGGVGVTAEWTVGQAAWLQCVGVAHTAVPSVSVCVWCPSAPFQNWREEARDLSFIHHLSVPWVRCLCALRVGMRVMHEILEAKSSGGEVSLIAVLDTSPWQHSY